MYYDVDCPYCGKGNEICHDDGYGYEEDELHEQECDKCDKLFAYTTSISFNYEAQKADCLNGGEHVLKKVVHFPNFWPDWERCVNCGEDFKGKQISFQEAIKDA